MNPVSLISLLYTLFKDKPPAVNIQYIPPVPSLLPEELKDKFHTEGFVTAQLWIDNLSNQVLEKVRINLPTPVKYKSIIQTDKHHQHIDHEYLEERHELLIEKVDPKESILVIFYPDYKHWEDFKKPQIIINNQAVTKLMEALGEYKKFPEIFRLNLFLMFIILIIIITIVALGYHLLQRNEFLFPDSEAVLINSASKILKDEVCLLKADIVTDTLKQDIMSTPEYPNLVLKINGVTSTKALWAKEKLVYFDCQ